MLGESRREARDDCSQDNRTYVIFPTAAVFLVPVADAIASHGVRFTEAVHSDGAVHHT